MVGVPHCPLLPSLPTTHLSLVHVLQGFLRGVGLLKCHEPEPPGAVRLFVVDDYRFLQGLERGERLPRNIMSFSETLGVWALSA